MKHLKQLLCAVILITSLLLHAQDSDKGIHWTTGLSWEQVKEKAKQENKYIFLDCFTTWCGPCKRMDGEVYSKQSVGDYFNQRFIPVRVQMDITPKDNEQVRSWYSDAKRIGKQLYIRAYPTLVFISPQGDVTDQKEGFKDEKDIVAFAENATKPGMAYKNIYREYDELITAYRKGERNYDKYPFMINIAKRQRDTISNQLEKELVQYMLTLKPAERYTKERLEVFRDYVYASTTHMYGFYFKDGKIIDKVMGEPGYSRQQIDKSIQAEIVAPFFEEQNKNPNIAMSGMYMGGGPPQAADNSEADWNRLEQLIRAKYNSAYTKRNLLIAKIEWYTRHRNVKLQRRYQIVKFEQYPPNPENVNDCSLINGFCWDAFMTSTDSKILKKCSKYMEKIIKTWSLNPFPEWVDTYANLLYKLGIKKEAIYWEQKAAEKDIKTYSSTVEQMKRGEPTWGAVWKH